MKHKNIMHVMKSVSVEKNQGENSSTCTCSGVEWSISELQSASFRAFYCGQKIFFYACFYCFSWQVGSKRDFRRVSEHTYFRLRSAENVLTDISVHGGGTHIPEKQPLKVLLSLFENASWTSESAQQTCLYNQQ